MPILRMLASTGEEHTRPTPRGCDLIKGIITLSELVSQLFMLRLYIHYCDIPHCIANVSLCILHGPFYGAWHYQHVSSDIRCNQQEERSRKGRHMNFMSHNNYVLDVMS